MTAVAEIKQLREEVRRINQQITRTTHSIQKIKWKNNQ